MKIYLRLLSYCQPLLRRVVPYTVFTFFAILFGLLNFTLLMPLLNVLFGLVDQKTLESMLIKPEFEFSVKYASGIFNYYFAQTTVQYGKFAALQLVTGIIVISVMLTNIFKYLSIIQIELLKIQIVRNLRNAVFEKVIGMHVGFFTEQRKGDILSRVTSEVSTVENSMAASLSVLFREPITLITYFITLLFMSTKLTLFTLAVIPISGLIISFFNKKIKKTATQSYDALGRLVSTLEESLTGIRVIKAFNAENYVYNKYKFENNTYTHFSRKMNLRRELASPFSEFSGVLVVSFILLYGGSLVLSNNSELSASEFVAYIIIFSQVLRPAKAISTSFTGMQSGVAAAERIFTLLDTPQLVQVKAGAERVTKFKSEIRFEGVKFRYQDKDILHGINLNIKAGQMVALVGPSGGGKSTIADLIPRFYDPYEGQITLDGQNLKDIDPQSLRKLMGIVTQESILFNDSIYNNIAFGRPNVQEIDIINAAKIANAHDFILQTELGYQTKIGDRGIKLSGGQRQRISIARAVLQNPPILILDEATSALDTESEKQVQQALDNLMKGRTSIVIAHRLSTVQHADMILVIKEGKIIESGNHSELILTPNGLYQKLQHMQKI